jgi:hypothetical protein
MAIRYIFFHFGTLQREKSGNPDPRSLQTVAIAAVEKNAPNVNHKHYNPSDLLKPSASIKPLSVIPGLVYCQRKCSLKIGGYNFQQILFSRLSDPFPPEILSRTPMVII